MKTQIIFIFLAVLVFTSCTERIELDLNTEDNVRLVVDANLTTESKAHLVKLDLTKDYFEEGVPGPATNAIVTFSDGTNIETLTELSPGMYYTSDDYAGVINTEYILEINYNDEIYKGSSTLEPVSPIDSLSYEILEIEDEEEEEYDNYSVTPYFQEPSELGNYYIFKLLKNGEYYTENVTEWFFTDDSAVNGNYIGDIEFFTLQAEPGDTITFEQTSINQEVFDNLNAILLETAFRGGLFDGAPANVPSNIDNGAVGLFITSDISTMSLVLE